MDIPSWLIDIVQRAISILLAGSPLLVPHIRDFVAKKIQLSFDKALENKKTLNERKNYISKHRFDLEFTIYQELSKAFFHAVVDISELFPIIAIRPADKDEREKCEETIYQKALQSCIDAQNVLFENAPFISENLFDKFDEIIKLCKKQLFEHAQQKIDDSPLDQKSRIDNCNRTKDINEKLRELNNQIREYLSNLDTLD